MPIGNKVSQEVQLINRLKCVKILKALTIVLFLNLVFVIKKM